MDNSAVYSGLTQTDESSTAAFPIAMVEHS